MNARRLLITASLLVLAAGLERPARAESCSASVPDPGFTGDVHYNEWGACADPYYSYFWKAFDFDGVDWNDGFGYGEPCDVTRPLGRTMNALYALQYSSPNPDFSSSNGYQGSILDWAGVYAANKIDELDARCYGGFGSVAKTWYFPSPDERTELYVPFFFSLNVAERAAAILHEARHASEKKHDSSKCNLGGNCDSSWGYKGAFRYHVSWAAHFAHQAVGVPFQVKQRLVDRINVVIDDSFEHDPGFRLTYADVPLLGDVNNDGRDEIIIWRPSNGLWFAMDPLTFEWRVNALQWGLSGDKPFVADFDGDGRDDFAIWRPADGTWFVKTAGGNLLKGNFAFGNSLEVPLVGDFDGDGKADFARWRPSTGMWSAVTINGQALFTNRQWGVAGDVPLVGDLNGDGRDDLIIWRPTQGTWYAMTTQGTVLVSERSWGLVGDVPLVHDVNGDGRDDLVIWWPSGGQWFAMTADNHVFVGGTPWGEVGDVPLLGKIDAGSTSDLVVWRPREASWWARAASGPPLFTGLHYGHPY